MASSYYSPVLQVIVLKSHIKSLHYVKNTDELWILTGNQPQFQDVIILSRASEGIPTDVHPLLPAHTVFDSVRDELQLYHQSLIIQRYYI